MIPVSVIHFIKFRIYHARDYRIFFASHQPGVDYGKRRPVHRCTYRIY